MVSVPDWTALPGTAWQITQNGYKSLQLVIYGMNLFWQTPDLFPQKVYLRIRKRISNFLTKKG